MSRSESPNQQFRPPSHPENKDKKSSEELSILSENHSKTSTLRVEDVQVLDIHQQDRIKLRRPRPPEGRQKPVLMASVRKTQPANAVGNALQGTVAHPVNLDPESQPLDYPGLRFDEQGMIFPHSVLGSLDDFRSYLQSKGETELVKRIPKSCRDLPSEAPGRHHSEVGEKRHGLPSRYRNIQSNALQNWHTHMMQRRQQQGFLSEFLDRPVENLLMNQADHFRETQEQREILSQVMSPIHSGYGYSVASGFWSLPQRYGDEMSGITATLTQTEQGRREPVTHVAQPSSIRQESGIICAETLHPASRTWSQSAYLQHLCQEPGKVLMEKKIKKQDFDGLEVIGSGLMASTFVIESRSPLLEKEEEEKEHEKTKKDNHDPLAQYDDVLSDALLIPALRVCGQLATWCGNSPTDQGEVGIRGTVIFEALTGETASSHLELHNEGSTAIFFSWQKLPVPCSFSSCRSKTKSPNFYFNSSSGVIRPGDTQRMEFIFKSEEPGSKTELWQLNTHPLLLQGASLQFRLTGVALYQDKTADKRHFVEAELEKRVMVKLCQSIVNEVLQGVRTPERPSSPAELYITVEQEFLSKNPKLQYQHQPVEDLQKLWQEVNPGHTWDLSVTTLRKAVLSLPKQESAQEKCLAQMNSLLLKLSEYSEPIHNHLTATAIGQHLWRKLVDMMVHEAMRLRKVLSLPEKDTWIEEKEKSLISDADMADSKDEKSEKKGEAAAEEERSGARSGVKDIKEGKSKSATAEKSMEDSRKKGKRKAGKRLREKRGQESPLLTDTDPDSVSQQPPDDRKVEPKVMATYKRLLHQKVYALMEDLVDTMCDLMDELNEEDEQDTNTANILQTYTRVH